MEAPVSVLQSRYLGDVLIPHRILNALTEKPWDSTCHPKIQLSVSLGRYLVRNRVAVYGCRLQFGRTEAG